MATKRGLFKYESDTNQLEYKGVPGSCAYQIIEQDGSGNTVSIEIGGKGLEDDPDSLHYYLRSLHWQPLERSYAPVLAKFRVRSDNQSVSSNWSVPVELHGRVRYDVYRRVVKDPFQEWLFVKTVEDPTVYGLMEIQNHRIQYLVAIHHRDNYPDALEGCLNEYLPANYTGEMTGNYSAVTNPYCLFRTDALACVVV